MTQKGILFKILLFAAILSCAASSPSSLSQDNLYHRRAQEVLGRMDIGEPAITFAGKVVQLIFPLSDQVPDGSISVDTFSDPQCSVDINGNDYLVPSIIYDDNPNPDGTKNREVILRFDVEPNKIKRTSLYFQDDKDQFFMRFCTRLNLHSGDAETTIPIVNLDTSVLLEVNLLGDIGEEVDVIPTDPSIESAKQVYFVEGFLCDDDLNEIIYAEPRVQGSTIRVCVKPRDDALMDGVYMRRVDSFVFESDNLSDGSFISQAAVKDGESANSDLTELNCERGWDICYFDTQLNADFYSNAGIVYGYGEAWLQFGSGSFRKLSISIPQFRNLQEREEGAFAGSGQFGLRFLAIPGTNFEYGARAYECDTKNKELDPVPVKTLGDTIRVCVVPDEASQQLGITINRVESWTWSAEDGAFQSAIDSDGNPAPDTMTVVLCSPGSYMCIFRTQFTPDFFTADGEITGVGNVVLQYAETPTIAASRRLSSTTYNRRKLQLSGAAQSDSVGSVEVSVVTPAKVSKDGRPSYCDFDHKISEWWTEESMNDRYMYIAIACVSLIGSCCSFLLCWGLPCLCRSEEEEETDQGIKVNIGVTSDKQNNLVENATTTKNGSSRHIDSEGSTHGCSDASSGERLYGSSSSLQVPNGSDDPIPTRDDVCFNDIKHPGTKVLLNLIKKIQKKSPESSYGPEIYHKIKRGMGDVRYFRESSAGAYIEVSKKERIHGFRKLFAGEPYSSRDTNERGSSRRSLASSEKGQDSRKSSKMERHGSRRSMSKSSSKRDIERKESKKNITRSSSRKSMDGSRKEKTTVTVSKNGKKVSSRSLS